MLERLDVNEPFLRLFRYIPVLALLLTVFIVYANTVDDLDLWWHLKHGEFIYETRSIPQKDHFAYTTYIPHDISSIGKDEAEGVELPVDENNRFWLINLNHSWLSELVFYSVYLLAGFKGLGILKSLIFVITYLVLYLAMLKRGANHLISFLILCLIAILGVHFNYTRPQTFSFLLFSCLLYTLYDYRNGGKSIYLLPAIMLLWANLHGGFILGVVIISAFFLGESVSYLLNNMFGISKVTSLDKDPLKKLAAFSFISAAVSLINPNSYKPLVFPLVLRQSIFAHTEESQSPMLYEYHEYWLMLVMLIAAILILLILTRLKRFKPADLFLSVVLIISSLTNIRFIIFFALGAGPILAHSMACIGARIKETGIFRVLAQKAAFSEAGRKGSLYMLASVLAVAILLKTSISGNVLKFDIREKRYPSGAVDFIETNNITGNMFNLYNWGGYLIWRLGPELKVFIDGRALNETVFFHAREILGAKKGEASDTPLWKRLLNAYDINYAVIRAVSTSGYIYPLVDELYADSDWHLVYADGKSVVFLKDTMDNYEIIHQNYLPKEKIIDEIIAECKQGIKDKPATWGYYETLGLVYMNENRLSEALAMFKKYLSMNPYNNTVRHYHDLLEQYLED